VTALLASSPSAAIAGQASTPTSSAEACVGLDAYSTAFLAAERDFGAFNRKERVFGLGRDVTTVSVPGWREYAEHAEVAQIALRAIDPPPWASEWHRLRIERLGFLSALAREVVRSGVLGAAAFIDEEKDEQGFAAESNALEQIVEACPPFRATLQEWILNQGYEPAATPAP
jgi:hypothetical protein